jgi:2,4-dienoyl-CoA reductase-like NADH-dependent reductase (Old Yellow Enzyme family)
MTFAKPHVATESEIATIIGQFAHAAQFLEKAGYDGIELHVRMGTSSRNSSPPPPIAAQPSMVDRWRIVSGSSLKLQTNAGSASLAVSFSASRSTASNSKTNISRPKRRGAFAKRWRMRDSIMLSWAVWHESLAFKYQRESTKKRESFFLEFAEQIVKSLSKTKTYITGGFKTVGVMVKALEAIDGVGLARPACQELHLPKGMLSGKLSGAIKQ